MARRHLEGQSWSKIAEAFGVSKSTAKRAARELASTLPPLPDGSLRAIEDVDVEALLALGIEAHAVALKRGLSLLMEAENPAMTIGAANSISRVLTSVVSNLRSVEVLADPDLEAQRARNARETQEIAERMVRAVDSFRAEVRRVESLQQDEAVRAALRDAADQVVAAFNEAIGLDEDVRETAPLALPAISPGLEAVPGEREAVDRLPGLRET